MKRTSLDQRMLILMIALPLALWLLAHTPPRVYALQIARTLHDVSIRPPGLVQNVISNTQSLDCCTIYLPLMVSSPTPRWHPQTPPLTTTWTSLVSPANAHPEYPRPQLVRDRWLNLNGEWQFASGSLYSSPPFNQTLTETILVPFPVESALSGIMRHEETLWYRRTFTVPNEWAGQRVLLNFDAVDWETTAFVNQSLVGVHRGGYDSFTFDVTDQLINGPNELVVKVYDPTDNGNQPMGKQRLNARTLWYSPVSGIWQTVWLEPVANAHITRLDMESDLEHGALLLTVRGSGITTETVEAMATLGGLPVSPMVTGSADVTLSVPITGAHGWSPHDPFLYDLNVKLRNESTVVDQVSSYFGLRTITVTKVGDDMRPLLNNQFVFQLGVLDQGYWPDGLYTSPTDDALRFDIEQAKALGYNTIRKHVKVEPARRYYWADRLGLLVWQDMPSMRENYAPSIDDQAQFENELRAMIDQHRSFPSIVTWVVFNEGWGQFNTVRLTTLVKALDASRLVDSASGWNDRDVGDVIDVHHYVDPIAPAPSTFRVSALGEFGGVGLMINSHTWTDHGHAPEWAADQATLTQRGVQLIQSTHALMLQAGLSAAIYTQLYDIEEEPNGWLTYDRAVMKPILLPIQAAQQHLISSSLSIGMPYTHTARWTFDEGSGLMAHDAFGHGNDAVLINGPQWITGAITGALSFDGLNDYVSVGRSLLRTDSDYTVAAWVKPATVNDIITAISQDGEVTGGFMLQYIGSARQFAFRVTNSDTVDPASRQALSPFDAQPDTWYFVAGVHDAAQQRIKLYIDGSLISSNTFSAAWNARGMTVIGRAKWNGDFNQYWHGSIDDTSVFDRALSDSEILELYSNSLH